MPSKDSRVMTFRALPTHCAQLTDQDWDPIPNMPTQSACDFIGLKKKKKKIKAERDFLVLWEF